MKKFKIYTKLVFDIIMGIIMIPFILVMLGVMIFAFFLHFLYWWNIRKIKK
jgi:uncharacterized membrane protein